MIEHLELQVFQQHAEGNLVHENGAGHLQQLNFATTAGTLRVSGGMNAIVEALASQIPDHRIHKQSQLTNLNADGHLLFQGGRKVKAKQIVLALPPRIAAKLAFEPALSSAERNALKAVPTWMAGHAKFVAVYETPFWRADGLSGDAMSQRGPLAEVHDATGPDDEGPGA